MTEQSVADRFWSKVDKSGECWVWRGVRSGGYGRFWHNGMMMRAHRVAWELSRGPIERDAHVCHSCDNPPCVNPAHLWLGNAEDNARDRERKGRRRHTLAKLREVDIADVMILHRSGWKAQQIADRFGVSHGAIRHIVLGDTWKHLNLVESE